MADSKDDGLRSDGFLSRWARRKQDVLAGKPVAEPIAKPAVVHKAPPQVETTGLEVKQAAAQQNIAQAATGNIATGSTSEAKVELPPAPTLQDAGALTPASDFKPYMASNVSPEVKNAAMKKLFADPHYNIMDMMDTYVDDYSKPDPMPESMLRQLASVKFLRLFERDEEEEGAKDGSTVGGKPLAAAQEPASVADDSAAGKDAVTDAATDVDTLKTASANPMPSDALLPATSGLAQGPIPPNTLANTLQPLQAKLPFKPHTP